MKFIKNALLVAVLGSMLVGCVKKEPPKDGTKEENEQTLSREVSSDVASLNASISQGVVELKRLNDPYIGDIYNAINNLTGESTINELSNINDMVQNHLQAMRSGQVTPNGGTTSGIAADLANVTGNNAAQTGEVNADTIRANLNALKKVNKQEYDKIMEVLNKLDLDNLSHEDYTQINNLILNTLAAKS